eukprot:SAG31_NODE_1520_length_8024_cov_7.506625_2_plen_528_part_00
MGKQLDKAFREFEKRRKKYKKEYEANNSLVAGELTLRVFDAQAWAKWEDQTQVFMSRMERLKLENHVAAAFAAKRPMPFHTPPQYSLELTDTELLDLAQELGVIWTGIRTFAEAEAARTAGAPRRQKYTRQEKKLAESMFLTRTQRRALESRVAKIWMTDIKRVRMPILCIQYSDHALVALAKRMGIKWSGPQSNPDDNIRALWARMDRDASGELDASELRDGLSAAKMDSSTAGVQKVFSSADQDGDGRISKKEFLQYFEGLKQHPPEPHFGPPTAEVFHEFVQPLVEQYFDELPATGAVVTLVKDGRVFYNHGFGYSGTKGHRAASKARAERDKAKAEEDERLAKKKMEKAQDQAQHFLTEGAAALLKGVDPEDRDAMMDALRTFFETMDEDGSGWVEATELKRGLETAGMGDSDDVVIAVLNRADNDGDGRVTLEEFLICFETEDSLGVSLEERIARSRARTAGRDPRLEKVRTLFAQLDKEHRGVLTTEVLSEGIINSGLDLEDSAVNNLLTEVQVRANLHSF